MTDILLILSFVVRFRCSVMKVFQFSSIATLALLSPTVTGAMDVNILAADRFIADERILKPGKGGKGGKGSTPTVMPTSAPTPDPSIPTTCCEVYKMLLSLDKKCADALAMVESDAVCQKTYGDPSIPTTLTPFLGYATAVAEYQKFLIFYKAGVFPALVGQDCAVDTTGDSISLSSFGGWCLEGSVVEITDVTDPTFQKFPLDPLLINILPLIPNGGTPGPTMSPSIMPT